MKYEEVKCSVPVFVVQNCCVDNLLRDLEIHSIELLLTLKAETILNLFYTGSVKCWNEKNHESVTHILQDTSYVPLLLFPLAGVVKDILELPCSHCDYVIYILHILHIQIHMFCSVFITHTHTTVIRLQQQQVIPTPITDRPG